PRCPRTGSAGTAASAGGPGLRTGSSSTPSGSLPLPHRNGSSSCPSMGVLPRRRAAIGYLTFDRPGAASRHCRVVPVLSVCIGLACSSPPPLVVVRLGGGHRGAGGGGGVGGGGRPRRRAP